jgi:membrane protein YqaA with SNARE-associated domain
MEWATGLTWPIEIDTSTWSIALLSAFGVGFLLGALPVGAAEAIALAAAGIPSMHLRVGVILTFTTGHVAGKALWYSLGRLETRVSRPRLRKWIDKSRAIAVRHPRFGLGVMAMSALASVPPFHLTAVAAGLVHTPALPFLTVSFVGRLVRFATLAAFPSLLRYLLS